MYHQQTFRIMKLCHLDNHTCILEIELILTPILAELKKWFISTLKLDHLSLLFVCAFGDLNFLQSESSSHWAPYALNLYKGLPWYTLLNALDISKKTPLTSTSGISSNSVCISWIIDNKWTIHESPRTKPVRKGVKSLLLIK